MIVTAHQPNFLPGKSVLDKLAASDLCIWLDEVQFSHGSFTNRNRLHGRWLSVPVEHPCAGLPINRVRISEHGGWREAMAAQVGHDEVARELLRPYRLLIGLNLAVLRALGLPACPAVFQSHLDGGRAVRAVADEPSELLPISERLAMMVAEVGGDVYLSGQSGRRYLDERPFAERGIAVIYWTHTGPNPSALELAIAPQSVLR